MSLDTGRRRWCSSETKKERPRQGGAAEAEAHGSSQGGAEGALERNIGIRQESFRGKKKAASKPRNPLLGGRPPPLSGAGWQQHEALAFVACIYRTKEYGTARGDRRRKLGDGGTVPTCRHGCRDEARTLLAPHRDSIVERFNRGVTGPGQARREIEEVEK